MAALNGPEAIAVLAMVAAVGTTMLTLARAVARRIAGGAAGAREIEALRDEVAQLRADVEGVQGRLRDVDEIQNRLDFAERLLAQARERGLLNPAKER